MPDYKEAPQLQPADFEQLPYQDAEKALRDDEALSLVREDFQSYEAFRNPNHDRRWTANDALYFGNVPMRNWEGTNTPRSSLPWPISFDHVETAFPILVNAIFGKNAFFQVEPGDDQTTPQQAQQKSDELFTKLATPRYGYGVTGVRELMRAIRSLLLYGNGGIEIKWDDENSDGCIEWVDIRDFYFDPNAPTPHVDDGRSVIRRKFFTVQQLEDMRNVPGMSIPENAILNGMARAPQVAASDSTKRSQESLRGVQYSPEMTAAPRFAADRKVECLIYYSKARCIWILNREFVAYNEKNPYGFIPFAFAPCYEVLGRFYAMSVPDRLEENQRYIEALRNLRLDGLHMDLMPPRVMQRSLGTRPSDQRWAPGKVTMADTPKEAVMEFRPSAATQAVTDEVAQIEVESEKRTGISSLQAGVPRPGNANRTGTGMQMQMQGGALRLSTIVQNIEDYLIVPMLYKLDAITTYHQKEQAPEAPDMSLQSLAAGDPAVQAQLAQHQQSNVKVKFIMTAASRMIDQEKLMQLIPFYFQFVLQGPLMQEMHAVGKTFDEQQFFRMIQDATGIGELYSLIRPMTQQEQQMMMQPDPKTMAQMQQSQQEQQTRLQIMDKKTQTDLQKTAMQHDHATGINDEKTSLGLMKLFADAMQARAAAKTALMAGTMGGGPPQGQF